MNSGYCYALYWWAWLGVTLGEGEMVIGVVFLGMQAEKW